VFWAQKCYNIYNISDLNRGARLCIMKRVKVK